ncbi:hypothetical protein [Streptomyces graminilatus]|uniref:hypothetical protein n=1 Tax=Streptomyces graminilatus TaxID=1464070 RepID=UPI000AB2F36C|nr:hypothetical protein [Streptomyces graminilatus]
MILATAGDVTARLGRPLADAAETARVAAFIEDATALVLDWCQNDFAQHQDETFTLPISGSDIEIPRRYLPGLIISAVELDGYELAAEDWKLVGRVLFLRYGSTVGTVTLTGSWGWPAPPSVIKQVICSEVIRWLAVSPGTVLEKTGELEVQYAQTANHPGLSQSAKDSLKRFRKQARSLDLWRPVTPF